MAFFYESEDDYLDGVMRFISSALAAGEPVAAAVPPEHARLLRERLNGSAAKVKLIDMFELGRNPARIIPAVAEMQAEHENARLHYVGEPIWPGRSDEETREATRHEALVNLAWPGTPITALCPYDASSLSEEVLADAERTHPYVVRDGEVAASGAYAGGAVPVRCDEALAQPPPDASSMLFGSGDLGRVRALVGEVALGAGLDEDRTGDLLVTASELSTNAVRHGLGSGTVSAWTGPGEVICQVVDRGEISDPLAGRRAPVPLAVGGLGLWIVNQLCDLVEVRTGRSGTTVRAHLTL